MAIAIANLLIKVPPSSHENENLSSGTSSTVNANTVKNPAPAQAAVNNGKNGVMSSRSGLLRTLLMDVVSTLKSKDLSVRHSARQGLVGIWRSLD